MFCRYNHVKQWKVILDRLSNSQSWKDFESHQIHTHSTKTQQYLEQTIKIYITFHVQDIRDIKILMFMYDISLLA